MIRRPALLVPALVAFALSAPARAVEPVNQGFFGVAIEGIDPVAYFTEGRPVAGSKEHTLEWSGATWRFASAENRARFEAEPERYAPQYGGYCAYAVSQGTTADIDPEAWKIVDGRLYLNLNREIQERWERNIPGYVEQADAHWPSLLEAD